MTDWIEWKGGECPVPPETVVAVRYANGAGGLLPGPAQGWYWGADNGGYTIIAYRIPAPASAEATGGGVADEVAIDTLAQWLHSEVEWPDPNFPHASWPEHDADDGQRGGGFVQIVPRDVVEKFRDIARRALITVSQTAAAPSPPPAPVPPAPDGWRVKALRWQGNSWPKIANFSFGQYAIYSDFEIFFNGYLVKNNGRHSFEGAQEIVRADLEARIRAAIEPAPGGA